MPLNTPEDYARLGAHLDLLDAPLAAFAAEHGYTVYPPLSGGRYPNRRITQEELVQEGLVFRTIHVAMADRPDGRRYDCFFPEIPYTVFAGAWIDDHSRHLRWHSAFLHTRMIPFSQLVAALLVYLDHARTYLAGVTAEHIYACGCTSPLGG